ncbi:hypothetical protein [Kribbella lupini]|uniref:Uncharacterized protein n=1 Tax=Kribbella lupini TaxID=291602 RepID=A0ABN1ZZT0_9ACTN
MNWPEGTKGRLLAGVYLIAFVAMATGVIWTLYNQATGGSGAQFTVGITLFVLAQLVITAMAFALRSAVRDKTDTYQRAWQRLSSGLEIPAAVRRLTA